MLKNGGVESSMFKLLQKKKACSRKKIMLKNGHAESSMLKLLQKKKAGKNSMLNKDKACSKMLKKTACASAEVFADVFRAQPSEFGVTRTYFTSLEVPWMNSPTPIDSSS